MSRQFFLGMRTTNWTSLSNNRKAKSSTRLDRGEYEWEVVIIGKDGKPKKRLTIWADDMDDAVKKSLSLIEWGEAVTVDGERFTL